MKYLCNVTCWVAWKKAMYNVGDIVEFSENEIVPSHFSSMEPPKVEVPKVEELKIEESKVVIEDISIENKKEITTNVNELVDKEFDDIQRKHKSLRKKDIFKE